MYPFVDSEIKNVEKVVAKSGWAPLPDGYKALIANFPEERAIAVDKTAWDWTMPAWVVAHYFHVKMLQTRNCTRMYQWRVFNRMRQVVGPDMIVRFPTGHRLRQTYWGQMKSGWFLTLSMNSMAQWAQHWLSWNRIGNPGPIPLCWAMGDDMLLDWPYSADSLKKYEKALARTGCILKHTLRSREFAGFRFEGNKVIPLYDQKHRFAIRHLDPANELSVVLSYALLYALSGNEHYAELAEPFGVSKPVLYSWATGLAKFSFEIPEQFLHGVE